jgi:hypothetical protein
MVLFGSGSALLYLLCTLFSPFLALWNAVQPRRKVWAHKHAYSRLSVGSDA